MRAKRRMRAFSKIIITPGTLRVIVADPDDDAILECAVIGHAHYLVSGDRQLLALGKLSRHSNRECG
jgi:predicted nucleic acid-binding protein